MLGNSSKKVLYLTFVFLTSTAGLLWAEGQGTVTLSFSDALNRAKTQNVSVIVASERVNQALAQQGQTRSGLLPQISSSAYEKRQTRDLRSTGIATTGSPLTKPFNTFDARVKITQTLFDPATIARLKAAHDKTALSGAQLRKTKDDVIAFVANLFIEAKIAHEDKKTAEAVFIRDQRELDIAKKRFHQGDGSKLQVKKSRATYAKSLYLLRSAKRNLSEKELDLKASLAIDDGQKIDLVWGELDWNMPVPTPQEIEMTLKEQPQIKIAQHELNSLRAERTAEKLQYLPKISAVGDYGPSGVEPDDFSETYTVGVQADLPLFEGGLRSAKIREAESKVKISEALLKDTERQVGHDILTAIDLIKEAKAHLKEKEQEWKVAQKEFDLINQQFENGTASQTDVDTSQVSLCFASSQRDEARANVILSKVNLAHALGRMDELLDNLKSEDRP